MPLYMLCCVLCSAHQLSTVTGAAAPLLLVPLAWLMFEEDEE